MEHVHVAFGPEQANKLLHGGSLLGGLRARSPGLDAGMACGLCPVVHMHVVGLSGARTHETFVANHAIAAAMASQTCFGCGVTAALRGLVQASFRFACAVAAGLDAI